MFPNLDKRAETASLMSAILAMSAFFGVIAAVAAEWPITSIALLEVSLFFGVACIVLRREAVRNMTPWERMNYDDLGNPDA